MDNLISFLRVFKGDIKRRRESGESLDDIGMCYESTIPGLAALLHLPVPETATPTTTVDNTLETSTSSSSGFLCTMQSAFPPSLPQATTSSKPPNAVLRGLCVPSTSVPLLSHGLEKIMPGTDRANVTTIERVENSGNSVVFPADDGEPARSFESTHNVTNECTDPTLQPLPKRRKVGTCRLPSIVSPEPASSSRPSRQRTERVPFDPLAHVSILKERDFATPEHAQSRLDDIAFNTLRDEFGMSWKKVHGKGQHKDWHRYIYVNPKGKKYTLESGAVEGTDFFLTPQAALDYCRQQVVQNLTA